MKKIEKLAEAKNGKAETKTLTVVKTEKEQPKALTIEERIAQVMELGRYIEQRKSLKVNLAELEEFKLSADDSATSMSLGDGQGNRWQFSNTYLLTKVVGLLQDEFKGKIAEVEAKINLAA